MSVVAQEVSVHSAAFESFAAALENLAAVGFAVEMRVDGKVSFVEDSFGLGFGFDCFYDARFVEVEVLAVMALGQICQN